MTTVNTYGVKPLRRVQFGFEVTPGTQVLATSLWRGENATLQDDTKTVIPVEDVGILSDIDRAYIPSKGATLTLANTPATYEQLPYLGEWGIKSLKTGVADGGGGSGKIYTYPFPTTQQATATPSFETGDNARMRLTPWGILESFKLSGKVDEAVMMSAVIKTRAATTNTLTDTTIAFDNAHHITDSNNGLAVFPIGTRVKVNGTASNNGTFTVTASAAGSLTVTETTATEAAGGSVTLEQDFTTVSIPAVKEILFNQCKLYIDANGGTIGTTQLTGTFLGFEFDYTSGQKGQPAGDGRLDFAFQKATKPTGKLKLTYEMNNGAKAEEDAWLAHTPRLIRIKNTGVALTTAGSVYSFYTMILDVVGQYTKFSSLKDSDGDDTVDAELQMGYDVTAALLGQLIVVNQLASLA